MIDFFANLIGMSIQASAVIVVVLLLRLLFQKINISKKYVMVLWLIPFVCLVLPWRITSPVGVWEKAPAEYDYEKVIGNEIGGVAGDNLNADGIVNMNGDTAGDSNVVGSDSVNSNANDVGSSGNSNDVNANAGSSIDSDSTRLSDKTANDSMASSVKDESQAEIIANCLAILWGIGVVGLGIYSALSFWKLKQQLRKNIPVRERVYFVDELPVPMVVGLVKSKIYIPSGVEKEHIDYVIAHEETHIRRKDTWTKLAAYAITCIHWFNPLVWLAYNLMIKDMEMSCDEETILHLGENKKKEYATALLQLSTGKRNVFAIPLAFGEGSTKGRIMNVLKYKKTKTVLAVVAVVIGVVVAAVFLTKGEGTAAEQPDGTKDVQTTESTESTETTEIIEDTEDTQDTSIAGDKEGTEETLPPEDDGTASGWLKKLYYEEGGWSRLFAGYGGTKIQRVEYSAYASYSPALRNETIFYEAEDGEDIQTILKKMATYMYDPLMEEQEGRPYTITKYALEDSPITQVQEDAWIVEYINGYYAFEGVDLVSMNVAWETETPKNGMIPFIRQGSEDTYQYILLKEGNVYRLERYFSMLPSDEYEDPGDRNVVYEIDVAEENLTPMQKVMLNQTPFLGETSFSNDDWGWHKVEECHNFWDFTGKNYKYFCVVDLDHDGEDEVCISYNSGDILVLHEEDGVVYGYGDAFRGMNPIYINGTAEGSGSASTWYLYGNYSFEGNVYSSPVLLSVEYRAKEEEPNYYKNGYPSEGTQITKEEYEQLREEYKAEKAKDYSLTIENILKYVP